MSSSGASLKAFLNVVSSEILIFVLKLLGISSFSRGLYKNPVTFG
jgi:hypothetical protein